MKIDKNDITDVVFTMYRTSQYPTLNDAIDRGAVWHAEAWSFAEAYESAINMAIVADMMQHQSAMNDIRVEIVINCNIVLDECFLFFATNALTEATKE